MECSVKWSTEEGVLSLLLAAMRTTRRPESIWREGKGEMTGI